MPARAGGELDRAKRLTNWGAFGPAFQATNTELNEGTTMNKGELIEAVGTFSVKDRAARTGRNPATGETIQIAASRAPGFKAGKALKDAVN